MVATDIEAIFSPASSYVMTSYMITQADELGIDAPFIMSDASYDDALLDVCGSSADGAMLTNGLFADDPAFAQFAADYQKKHPEWSSNYFVLYTYDCVELLVWAVKKANSFDGDKIKNAIESAENVKLFTDPSFSMDPLTHNPLNKTITVITVENGKWKLKDSFRPQ
jgi:branched-chain amino acid transport system substrate-binding protein